MENTKKSELIITEIKSLNEKYSKNSTIIAHTRKLAESFNSNSNDYELIVNADDNTLDNSSSWFSISLFKDSKLVKNEKIYC